VAVPRVLLEPDKKTFATKVISAHTMIEAAIKLAVRQGINALSEMTFGICLALGGKGHHSPRRTKSMSLARWTASVRPRSSAKRRSAPLPVTIARTSMRCASAM
jgi:hypothetical protein